MAIIQSAALNEVWDLLSVRRRAAPPAPADAESAWDVLQQPARLNEVDPQYLLLRAALDTGWRIEEPIYLRPRWGESTSYVYHFILQRGLSQPRLLSVPQGPEVERLVHDEGLRVVHSR